MKIAAKVNLAVLGLSLVANLWITADAQSYDDVYALKETLFKNYSSTIRPNLNQSEKIELSASFSVLGLIDVNEKQLSFTINGFMSLSWTDERLQWNPSDHNGVTQFVPDIKAIWLPRMMMMNTMGARDMFEDDYAPIRVLFNGNVFWYPGGLFPGLCLMDLRTFPFDEHRCALGMVPMQMFVSEVELSTGVNGGVVSRDLYTENGEWEVNSAVVLTGIIESSSTPVVEISFEISRLPSFFLINTLIPVILFGLLNVLGFAIPIDAGEKISYSVSVLLAFSVYMGIVNEFLPTNSVNMPYVTRYIFLLITMSVCCCIFTILVVYLHHKEQEHQKRERRESKLQSAYSKLSNIRRFTTLPPKDKGDRRDVLRTTSPSSLTIDKEGDELDPENPANTDKGRKNSSSLLTMFKRNRKSEGRVHPEDTVKIRHEEEGQEEEEEKKCTSFRYIAAKLNKISFVIFSLTFFILTMVHILLMVG